MKINQILKDFWKDVKEVSPKDINSDSVFVVSDDNIKLYTRTLLESFGEEIIAEDETEVNQIERNKKFEIQTYYVITANMIRRNQLRAEQRLKVKEILQNIT